MRSAGFVSCSLLTKSHTHILSLASSRVAVSFIIARTFGRVSILSVARSAGKSDGCAALTSGLEIETGRPCKTQTLLFWVNTIATTRISTRTSPEYR